MPNFIKEENYENDQVSRLLHLIAIKAAYYRANPHRFVSEVLGIHLKLFQKILFWALNFYNYFFYIAARGQGKTYLVALFCVVRAILYPGSKIVISSATKSQSNEVLLKIESELVPISSILKSEIEKINISQNLSFVKFKNGSRIRVVTASDNARGARANILIIDESRMVSDKIRTTVLRKFLTAPRHPKYLDKPEFSHLEERNKEIYMSSAYFKDSEMYEQALSYTALSLDDTKRYFICGLPYQLSIKEHLLSKEQVLDEMSESTFSDITWMMEMEALFYGCGDENLFGYSMLTGRRKVTEPFFPIEFYIKKMGQVPKLDPNEERILSVDVALMASRKNYNDASALEILTAKIYKNSFASNLKYIDTQEGLKLDDLGLLTMRTFYLFNCTQLVIDGNGVGQGLVDYCLTDRYDPLLNITYPAINCCNNDEIAARCNNRNARKAMWVIKANATTNNDMCLSLRSGFQSGLINLPINETDAEDYLTKNYKGYSKSEGKNQALYMMPFIQSSLLIEELAKLEYENKNGNIRVFEKHNMRKDRYSSLLYAYWVLQQIIRQKKKPTIDDSLINLLPIKKYKFH